MFKGIMQFKVTVGKHWGALRNVQELLDNLQELGEQPLVIITIGTNGQDGQDEAPMLLAARQPPEPVSTQPVQEDAPEVVSDNGAALGDFWAGLADDLSAVVGELEAGQTEWRTLPQTDRRGIALHVVRQLAGEDKTLSMAEFEAGKPSWMPTASAITQMFMMRWSELVRNATR